MKTVRTFFQIFSLIILFFAKATVILTASQGFEMRYIQWVIGSAVILAFLARVSYQICSEIIGGRFLTLPENPTNWDTGFRSISIIAHIVITVFALNTAGEVSSLTMFWVGLVNALVFGVQGIKGIVELRSLS